MVYTQHRVQEDIQPKRLALLAGASIVLAGSAWGWWRAPSDMERYAQSGAPRQMSMQAWTSSGFRLLPSARREVAGEREEAFTVQLACPEPQLREAMRRAGWAPAPGLSVTSVLRAIAPQQPVGELPLLPKYDGGLASAIQLMRLPAPAAKARDVLRLWKSGWELPGGTTIWYGAFYRETQVRPNYSFLREQAQVPGAFSTGLVSAAMRRARAGHGPAADEPELWVCGHA
jgi:hypothetical protein